MSAPIVTVFDPIEAPSIYQETLARLGTAIRIGLLAPGDRLPPERELAEQLSISRSTLRQALRALTLTGHLVALRGRAGGTFVAAEPPLASGTPYPLERARSLLDWRASLELGTVQMAAERATEEQRRQLDEAVSDFDSATLVADIAAFRRADARLHVRLAESARGDRAVQAMTVMQGELSDLVARLDPDEDSRVESVHQHREVVAAVVDGDGAGAQRAMRAHLAATDLVLTDLLAAA